MQGCLNSVDGNYFVRPHIASLKIVEYAYGNKNREDFIDRKCKGVVVAKREVYLARSLRSFAIELLKKKKKINGCRQARSRQGRMIFGPVEVTTSTSMILDRQMKTQNLTVHYT